MVLLTLSERGLRNEIVARLCNSPITQIEFDSLNIKFGNFS